MQQRRDGFPGGEPELIRRSPVRSIVEGEGGAVWVGAGFSLIGGEAGQVLLIENGSVRTIVDESSLRCDSSGELSLPQPAAIQGLTLDVEGRPLIVAGDLGVFRIADESIVPLIQKRMVFSYSADKVIHWSLPVGIVATDRGILVASSSLGVFAFLEEDGAYEFSQIVLQ